MTLALAVQAKNIKNAAGGNMSFNEELNKIEQKEKFDPTIEIGRFDDIKSSIYFIAFYKKIKNQWGGEQDENIAKLIKGIDIKLDREILKKFEKITTLANDNEETLKWLALVAEKDEYVRFLVAENIFKYKGLSKDRVEKLMISFLEFYQELKEKFDINELIKAYVDTDIKKRKKDLPELKKTIDEAINFFKPSNLTISQIVYLPSNPLEKIQSGNGVRIGDTFYINSEQGNRVNEIHEFLHCVINPITEKLKLTSEDEQAIFNLCHKRLKSYNNARNILTEEIIRTYKTGFNKENKPGFDNFRKKLLSFDKVKLQQILSLEKEDALASNVDELLNNEEIMRKYYEKYIKDELSQRIWQFFEEYEKSNESFENYLLNNYKQILYHKEKR